MEAGGDGVGAGGLGVGAGGLGVGLGGATVVVVAGGGATVVVGEGGLPLGGGTGEEPPLQAHAGGLAALEQTICLIHSISAETLA